MSLTLICSIPYSKHYTRFTQNNRTSSYVVSSIPLLPHHPHPEATTAHYKYGSEVRTLQTFKSPPHEKHNTNTLVEKTKNGSKKHQNKHNISNKNKANHNNMWVLHITDVTKRAGRVERNHNRAIASRYNRNK
jgi:hypothetical protein